MQESGQPFFSIIIPTFNAEKYICRSLTSILNQTFENYECLIMDGASTDNTLQIAKATFENDSRFKIQSKSDLGVYDAMNKGILKSRGNYIYFLGADDYLIDKNVFSDVRSRFADSNIDVLYGNVNRKDLWNNYDGAFTDYKIASQNLCHQSIFYKRNVFDKVGFYSLKYKIQADWEHNWRWFFYPEITKEHYDRVIAYYEQGGMSSGKKDAEFRRDFAKKFIRNSSPQLKPLRILSILGKSLLHKAIYFK